MNFLDERDTRFVGLRKTLDARMKELTPLGIGVVPKQAEPITPRKENKLWESGIIGTHNSKALLNAVFFLCL